MKYKNSTHKIRIIFDAVEDNKENITQLDQQKTKVIYTNSAKQIHNYGSDWIKLDPEDKTKFYVGYNTEGTSYPGEQYKEILARINFEVELTNYQESLLSNIKILPLFKTLSAFESDLGIQNANQVDDFVISYEINYINDTTYLIKGYLDVFLSDNYTYATHEHIPFFAKILIVIYNRTSLNEISTIKI